MADEPEPEGKPAKKRGPKGGTKHQPGKGHDRKSAPRKKKRFADKAKARRRQQADAARKAWEQWDGLSDEAKRLLGPRAAPDLPRPADE